MHIERNPLAVVGDPAFADGEHLALLRLFLGGVGDDDPAYLLFAFIQALDNDSVVKRSDIHAPIVSRPVVSGAVPDCTARHGAVS